MLPISVEKTINTLCSSFSARAIKVESIYLYGSIALRDYIEGSSDIDFVAIVAQSPTPSDIQAITAAHEEVELAIPNTDMMGAYILLEDIGKNPSEIKPLFTYYDRQLHTSGWGADINPITWWILRKHGIKVYGSELTFSCDIAVNDLLDYVIRNLNSYWLGWIEKLDNQLESDSLSEAAVSVAQLDEAVEWCTLGMLRQWYTIREHDITSKVGSGFYGMKQLPDKWHGLIHEAITIKQRQPKHHYTSQLDRLADLVALLKFIHGEANRSYNLFLHSATKR